MIESLFLSLALALAKPAIAPPPAAAAGEPPATASRSSKITSEDRAALRCSAAFAIVGARQSAQSGQSQWPEINKRGREFFVVALAGLMDKRGLDRAALEREVMREAQNLTQNGQVDSIMPACMLMLEAAGL